MKVAVISCTIGSGWTILKNLEKRFRKLEIAEIDKNIFKSPVELRKLAVT